MGLPTQRKTDETTCQKKKNQKLYIYKNTVALMFDPGEIYSDTVVIIFCVIPLCQYANYIPPCHNLVTRNEQRSTNEFTASTQPVEYQRALTPALRVQTAGLAQKNAEGKEQGEKAHPRTRRQEEE